MSIEITLSNVGTELSNVGTKLSKVEKRMEADGLRVVSSPGTANPLHVAHEVTLPPIPCLGVQTYMKSRHTQRQSLNMPQSNTSGHTLFFCIPRAGLLSIANCYTTKRHFGCFVLAKNRAFSGPIRRLDNLEFDGAPYYVMAGGSLARPGFVSTCYFPHRY
jgi:hypothetical protein